MVETMQVATTRETNEIANNSNTNSRINEEKGSGFIPYWFMMAVAGWQRFR